METIYVNSEKAQMEMSLDDLRLLCNALNEVCNGIDVPEFETRLGATPKYAEAVMLGLREVIESIINDS